MCFDCVINYETELRRAGLYDAYEKAMIQGSLKAFLVDVEQYVLDSINTVDTLRDATSLAILLLAASTAACTPRNLMNSMSGAPAAVVSLTQQLAFNGSGWPPH